MNFGLAVLTASNATKSIENNGELKTKKNMQKEERSSGYGENSDYAKNAERDSLEKE